MDAVYYVPQVVISIRLLIYSSNTEKNIFPVGRTDLFPISGEEDAILVISFKAACRHTFFIVPSS